MFLEDRIDVTFMSGVNVYLDFNKTIELLEKILCEVMTDKDLLANRMALFANIVSDEYIDSDIFSRVKKYIPFESHCSNGLNEWSNRCNTIKTIVINGEDEPLNAVTEVSVAQTNGNAKKCFLCVIDVNTVFERSAYRFNVDALKSFVFSSIEIAKEYWVEFERFGAYE